MIGLGGHALLERGERPDAAIQQRHVRRAAQAIAPLVEGNDLIICHGNGPQIGQLALESENDPALTAPFPLDALGAQTQGLIGYWLVQELHNAGVRRPVTTVLTRTVVDAADPAFAHPDKFIGPGYPEERARALAAQHGWTVARDGEQWRRVVPSPRPRGFVERDVLHRLVDATVVVVCGGGGGIPVARDEAGWLTGVEAVVDKDLVAALLATEFGADRLLLLTDVPAVMRDFGTPYARPLRSLGISPAGDPPRPAGSIGPKVQACREFAEATGRTASIGALEDAAAVLAGTAGTTVGLFLAPVGR